MIILFYSIYTQHGCRHNFLGKLDKKLNACSPKKLVLAHICQQNQFFEIMSIGSKTNLN